MYSAQKRSISELSVIRFALIVSALGFAAMPTLPFATFVSAAASCIFACAIVVPFGQATHFCRPSRSFEDDVAASLAALGPLPIDDAAHDPSVEGSPTIPVRG